MQEVCYHCGLDCENESVYWDEKAFCCNGCKSVYEILNTDQLQNFYALNSNPGIKPKEIQEFEFDYLEDPQVQDSLLLFQEGNTAVIRFEIPVIHCTSCIWVLENLDALHPGILSSKVNFPRKTVQIQYDTQETSLKDIAVKLSAIGYKPVIHLGHEEHKEIDHSIDRSLITKLGVAGFCFGNTMLFAFPEYFTEFSDLWFEKYKVLFRYLMLLLSLPVVFYCAQSYFKSAYTGIKHGLVNIDIPISIGILVLFLRSIYEVSANISSGYFDSLCGLVFFMLVGKYFQQNTYKSLSFDRNFQSFYPLSVTKIVEGVQETIMLSQLEKGDRIWVRNGEMIPADAVLIKGNAWVDNSFITGESDPISKEVGSKIYAGGRQRGEALELEVIKKVDHSYLSSLWQKTSNDQQNISFTTLIEKVSRYFTFAVLIVALLGGIFWYSKGEIDTMFQVVTAVLIVACPCALALATPFTLGNSMRILGMHQIYTKDTATVEKLNEVQQIVLDKTGTLTETEKAHISYEGSPLSEEDKKVLFQAFQNSTHPLSRRLSEHLKVDEKKLNFSKFNEIEGKGMEIHVGDDFYKLGSKSFVGVKDDHNTTSVYVQKNGEFIGWFSFEQTYRKGLKTMAYQLKKFLLSVISGDNSSEQKALTQLLGTKVEFRFLQSPEDKLKYIENLQKQGTKVMMVGDGLNDAAALKQSDVGVAITDDINNFTPSSDVIMKGDRLVLLPQVFQFSYTAIRLVKISMLISFLYNIIGLSFALTGMLSPLVAAILMPISSITVVLFASISTWYYGNQYFR